MAFQDLGGMNADALANPALRCQRTQSRRTIDERHTGRQNAQAAVVENGLERRHVPHVVVRRVQDVGKRSRTNRKRGSRWMLIGLGMHGGYERMGAAKENAMAGWLLFGLV